MLALHISVPIACFRKGMAREYLETEPLPPPATCYGMLLSLVGQADRRRHIGARVTAGMLAKTETSAVLRTVWRVKSKPLGSSGNTRPDYQQLLTGASFEQPFIDLVVYLDSSGEKMPDDGSGTLESQVSRAFDKTYRSAVSRFGGLSLGESTHLVDSISLLDQSFLKNHPQFKRQRVFLMREEGMLSLPVWVDHVGSVGTRHVVGDLVDCEISEVPSVSEIPRIDEA